MIAIDMKMPENCFVCSFRNEYDACVASAILPIDGGTERPGWCPLLNVEKVMAERIIPSEDAVLVPEDELIKYAVEQAQKNIGKLILNKNSLHHRSVCPLYFDELGHQLEENILDSKIIRETCWVVEIGKEEKNE